MKVLFVCTYRSYAKATMYMAPFIYEQMQALSNQGVDIDVLQVHGGIVGYMMAWKDLRKKISNFHPDIIHAHFGLCGFLVNIQKKIPVVTTYHGSDINSDKLFRISRLAIKRSRKNIFVSEQLFQKAGCPKNGVVIPCGVDVDLFHPMDKAECRKHLGLNQEKKYVLFSKMFSDPVKNYSLAKKAIDLCGDVQLLEFVGYSREQAVKLMNAVDAVIMTSHMEGSPQFIKEALAVETPIVSVDVGDVGHLIGGVKNTYLCERNADELAKAIQMVIGTREKTDGRMRIMELELANDIIINKLKHIYENVANKGTN